MTSYLVNKDEISPTPLPIPVAENAEKKILKNTIKQLLNNVWVFPSFFSKYTENLDIAPPAGHSRKRRLNASDSYNLNPHNLDQKLDVFFTLHSSLLGLKYWRLQNYSFFD